jgi:PAS domain S-box-containing protein
VSEDHGAAPAREVPPPDCLSAAVSAATGRLVDALDDDQVGRILMEQVGQVLAAHDVRLGLLDTDPEWWVLRQASGPAVGRVGERQPRAAGLLGHVMEGGEPFRAANFPRHPLAAIEPGAASLGSVVAVPLHWKGEVLGAVLAARPPDASALTPGDAVVLQILTDLAAARLCAATPVQHLRARAQDLAALNPDWRPAPEEAGDFVIITGARDRPFLDVDAAACRVLGYTREVMLQRSMGDIIPLPPGAEHVDTLAAVRDQLLRGVPITFDTIVRRYDGSPIPVRLTIQRANTASAPPVYRCTFTDLSQEMGAQLRALQAEKQRLLQEISSGIAHELNNPLAVVLGNTEMLLEELHDPDVQALLGPARAAAGRISEVVQRLQQFAKPSLSAGWILVDLSQLANEVAEQTRPIWEVAPGAEGRVIRLRLETSPVHSVRGNPITLQEAVRELLANAVQALPQGGAITVSAREADRWGVLSISDTGVGMSDEVRQRCLEPFFTTRRPAGTGLGLNQVYHTVLEHRGRLQIERAECGGTRVTISLPLVLEDGDAPSHGQPSGGTPG